MSLLAVLDTIRNPRNDRLVADTTSRAAPASSSGTCCLPNGRDTCRRFESTVVTVADC